MPIYHYGRDVRSYLVGARESIRAQLAVNGVEIAEDNSLKSSPIHSKFTDDIILPPLSSKKPVPRKKQTFSEIKLDLERKWQRVALMSAIGAEDVFFEVQVSDGQWTYNESEQRIHYYHGTNENGRFVANNLSSRDAQRAMEAFTDYRNGVSVIHENGSTSHHFNEEKLHEVIIQVVTKKEISQRLKQIRLEEIQRRAVLENMALNGPKDMTPSLNYQHGNLCNIL